jgi:hypothetical protein
LHRSTLVSLLTAALIAAGAGSALAAAPSPSNPAGGPLGVVPAHGQANAAARKGGGSNLSWHGGPVMHTNTTYALYWGGTFATNYQSITNGFLTNVGAATTAGATSNVYFSDTQYYDGGGSIGNASSFGGSLIDSNPIPNDCSDSYTSLCVSDAAMQAEIEKVVPSTWRTPNSMIFVFTGKGVGSCYSAGTCAFSYYCAYHSNLSDGTPYANMPYAMTVPSACDSGQHPNNNDADATINVASHEHNEAITDPYGTAWYDPRGYENGDKCAWTFGSPLGGTRGSYYNQVINGGHYYLQREWSNQSSGCVLTGL